MKVLRTPLLAAALVTSVAAIGLAPAFAETASPTANPAATATTPRATHHQRQRMTAEQLVDGRIAFLKTELKITPDQETHWQEVAGAMRENAQAIDQARASVRQHRGTPMNAVERMEIRGQFAKVRAENDARLLSAFKPLYTSLSPAQQQTANALMGGHHGERHGWHHRA